VRNPNRNILFLQLWVGFSFPSGDCNRLQLIAPIIRACASGAQAFVPVSSCCGHHLVVKRNAGYRRQLLKCGRLVEQTKVGVAVHRQRNCRMAGQRLRHLGVNASGGQVADELVS
jgi:hypothetical protein